MKTNTTILTTAIAYYGEGAYEGEPSCEVGLLLCFS